MKEREFIIQRMIAENEWIDEDSDETFKGGVEKLDIQRDGARKSEHSAGYKFRIIKRVENIYYV